MKCGYALSISAVRITIKFPLDKCTDSKLYVAMNLSFACSLRMGEILGLTWENVHISDEDIAADNAYVYIDKELTRASKRAIETLGEKDIYYIFTPLMPNTSTRIILKKPKTDSSIRKVWLPKTLAYILREWKKSQDELKGFLGDEYQDFNLVVALPNGRPCEDRIILKEFAKLREDAGLPKVVFHSLRHSKYHLQTETEPRRSESHPGRYRPCRDRHDNQYLCSHSGRG